MRKKRKGKIDNPKMEGIRLLRKDRGWTQPELAEKVGLHPHIIGRIERGGDYNPTQATLMEIAKVFGVEVTRLY
jgi:transcriptional regulator with XRE-family HTH domain